MKARDMHNDAGIRTGFRISSARIGRHGVAKVAESIPGVQIVRKQARFAIQGRDDFCEFILDGQTFLAIEPFGDNTEFWIVAEPPAAECEQLDQVQAAFRAHRPLF